MTKVRTKRWIAFAGVVVVALASAGWLVFSGGTEKSVTAYFSSTVGLYAGSDVRVLGVAIGTVDAVEPQGKQVRVAMSVDADVSIPDDATALVVTPSLVSDRYVQLTPVYERGPTMVDGAVIPVERTAVPVELDELYASLDELTTALGPNGANSAGALSDFLDTSAKSLDGNGRTMNEMIRELGKATRTLSGSEQDLFATIDSIQRFTSMLADNDAQLRSFTDLLGQVSQFLAEDREEFAAALSELTSALGTVQGFIRDNRALIKSNVDKLAATTQLLADQKDSLAEALDRVPQALGDLLAAYDPNTGTLDVRTDLNEFAYAPGAAFDNAPRLPLPSSGDPVDGPR